MTSIARRVPSITYLLCGLFVFQSGCSTFGKNEQKEQLIPKASKPAIARLLSDCPLTQRAAGTEMFPLAAVLGVAISALVPPAIDVITTGVSEWLKEGASKRNASSTAVTDGMLWKVKSENVSPLPGCLVFVRGDITTVKPASQTSQVSSKNESWSAGLTETVNNRMELEKAGIYLKDYPEVYAEFRIDYSEREISADQINQALHKLPGPLPPDVKQKYTAFTGMTLRPVKLAYLKSGAEKGSSDEKNLLIEVKLEATVLKNGTPESQVLLDHPFDFGKTPIPSNLKDEQFLVMPAAKGPLVPPFMETTSIGVGDKVVQLQSLNLVNLRGTVISTESENKGDVQRAFAKSIKDKSSDLSKLLVDYLTDLAKKTEKKQNP